MKTMTLPHGTVLRDGDEYLDRYTGEWHPTKCAGRMVGIPNVTSGIYRRRISATSTEHANANDHVTPSRHHATA